MIIVVRVGLGLAYDGPSPRYAARGHPGPEYTLRKDKIAQLSTFQAAGPVGQKTDDFGETEGSRTVGTGNGRSERERSSAGRMGESVVEQEVEGKGSA